MNLNRIILIGRLTNDPEERFSNDGMEISKFRLAVSRPGRGGGRDGGGGGGRDGDRPDADFFNVTTFRNSAKFVNQYMRRGNLVAVEGRLEIDFYTDREGQKQTWVNVLADNVQSLQTRAEAEAAGERSADRGDRGERGGGGGGRGGRWEHDRDFEDEPAPPPARGGGGGPRRQEFPRPVEDDPFGEEAPRAAAPPRGRGPAKPSAPASGGGFDDDGDDPFADE